MRVLALALAISIAAVAAEPIKLPPDAQKIADLASAAPPEFHAWALLKLLAAPGLIKEAAARRQLIEQIYELASAARARYPVKTVSGVPHDSRSTMIALGSRSGLDGLSLQIDAVRLMLPIDKQKARQMFADIPKPAIPPLGCDDDLMPQLDDYYQLLASVAQEAFTPKERAREDPISLVLDFVGAISSPAQLAPAAAMLARINVSAEQRQLLYAKFGSAMESMSPDDRSFADVTSALTPLLSPDVIPAFQRFIANHAAAPRCQRVSQNGPQMQVNIAAPANALPAGDYKGELLWQSAEAKNIAKMASDLRINNSRVLTEEDRRDPAWQLQYSRYVDALEGWLQGDGESDAAFFHEKTSAWMAAADLATAADAREYALGEAVRFIGGSALEGSSPGEWFVEVRQPDLAGNLRKELLRAYANSGNPVLALYAALVGMAGPNV